MTSSLIVKKKRVVKVDVDKRVNIMWTPSYGEVIYSCYNSARWHFDCHAGRSVCKHVGIRREILLFFL